MKAATGEAIDRVRGWGTAARRLPSLRSQWS